MPMLVNLLVSLIVFGVILSVVWWLLTLIPVPPPIATAIRVVFAIICVIALLSMLFGAWSFPVLGHGYVR